MARATSGAGYVTVGTLGRATLRLHWSLAIGVVGAALSSAPLAWAGLLVIVIVHELGHAVLARRYRLAVHAIDVHLFGGRCVCEATHHETKRAMVAWGGVLGQAVVLGATWLLARAYPYGSAADTIEFLTYANLVVMAANLLPIPGLDGPEAWRLFRGKNLQKVAHRERLQTNVELIEAELARLERERGEKKNFRDLN